jgi:hypothetical protein
MHVRAEARASAIPHHPCTIHVVVSTMHLVVSVIHLVVSYSTSHLEKAVTGRRRAVTSLAVLKINVVRVGDCRWRKGIEPPCRLHPVITPAITQ